jgi:hypothetical protein
MLCRFATGMQRFFSALIPPQCLYRLLRTFHSEARLDSRGFLGKVSLNLRPVKNLAAA